MTYPVRGKFTKYPRSQFTYPETPTGQYSRANTLESQPVHNSPTLRPAQSTYPVAPRNFTKSLLSQMTYPENFTGHPPAYTPCS